MIYIVGLGNPGEEYVGSRHNIGRDILLETPKFFGYDSSSLKTDSVFWKKHKKAKALLSVVEIEDKKISKQKEKATLILPENYMNNSGSVIKDIVGIIGTSKIKGKKLILIHDEIDLAIGCYKISFGKSSGGHRGVESTIKQLKTKDFIRIRIGIAPVTPSGKIKKPQTDKAVVGHVLGKFTPRDLEILKKVKKTVQEIIKEIVLNGYEKAMNKFN